MPAANQPNTRPANEARRRIGDQNAAQRLRDRGWLVLEPSLAEASRGRQTLENRLAAPIGEVTDWVMAVWAPERAGRDLPRLNWRRYERDTGPIESLCGWSSARGQEALAELTQWADAFGLQRQPDYPGRPTGKVTFAGEVDGIRIEVDGYVDPTELADARTEA